MSVDFVFTYLLYDDVDLYKNGRKLSSDERFKLKQDIIYFVYLKNEINKLLDEDLIVYVSQIYYNDYIEFKAWDYWYDSDLGKVLKDNYGLEFVESFFGDDDDYNYTWFKVIKNE